MKCRAFALALLAASLVSANANAQTVEGKFRGMYVCEKLPTPRDILYVPIDLVIDGGAVQFARPLFNLEGTRAVGSELGKGTIDGEGRLHLTSEWSYLGNTAEGDYSGTLTPTGGTLTGTQTWRGADGIAPAVKRTCTAALVAAPQFKTELQPH
jgi:hypothetical protein